jgi:hypothetical protein
MPVEVPIHEHIEILKTHLKGVKKPSLEVDRSTVLGTDRRPRMMDFRLKKSELKAEIPGIIGQYESYYKTNVRGLIDEIRNLRKKLASKNYEFKTQALGMIDPSKYVRNNKLLEQDYNDAVMLKAYTLRVNDTDYVEKNNKLHALHEAAENIIRMHDDEENGYIEIKPDSVHNSNGGRRSSLRHIRKTRKNRKTKHHKHTHRYRHTK